MTDRPTNQPTTQPTIQPREMRGNSEVTLPKIYFFSIYLTMVCVSDVHHGHTDPFINSMFSLRGDVKKVLVFITKSCGRALGLPNPTYLTSPLTLIE